MKIGPKILVPFVQWPNLWATERMNSSTEAASKTVELTSNGLPNSEYVKSVPKNEPTWHFFQMSIFPTKIRSEKKCWIATMTEDWPRCRWARLSSETFAGDHGRALVPAVVRWMSGTGLVLLGKSSPENHRKKSSNIGLSWKFSMIVI